jgi:hypothetical protein
VELLLNLLWAALALGTLSEFLLRQCASLRRSAAVHTKALIALATVLVVVFPLISASDDLHPAIADLADPAKRISQVSAQLHQLQPGLSTVLLAAFLVFQVSTGLVALRGWYLAATAARALERERVPNDGRSPPRF